MIKNNVDTLETEKIKFINPFVSLNNPKTMFSNLKEAFKEYSISDEELKNAIENAYKELDKCRDDIRNQGEIALNYIKENHLKGIVLAGRPYHVDPEINHGIADLITSEGFVVLTEDSIAYKNEEKLELRVVDQWTYHSRL